LVVEVRTSTKSGGAGGDHAAMMIVRSEHRAQFTIIPNAIFRDDRLSIEAKGVLGYLLSHPHHWQVRLDHIGRTLRIGRKKLQRIFRELIGAGYVSREQPRTAGAHCFCATDYVVRDMPVAPIRPVDSSPGSRGGKEPADPRGRKGPVYKEDPQVLNGPAYKEIDNKKGTDVPIGPSAVEGLVGSPGEEPSHHGSLDPARFDADIVALFDDRSEGWELLCVLPDEILAQLRQRQRRLELDVLALVELRLRYQHLLAHPRRK
jgi:hypothetical protein